MNNKVTLATAMLLILISMQSFGQSFSKKIAQQFSEIWMKQPQEKVYLHTDKPYYSAGENIWFKAYLINASTHLPNTLSRFIYVELINNLDSIVQRQKIKKDSIGFSGYINLSPKLEDGYYSLRAYTNWMQNISPEYHFTKSLFIGNKIDDRVNCTIEYSDIEKENKRAILTFTNTYKNPIVGKKVIIRQNWMKDYKQEIDLTTNDSGKISLHINKLNDNKNKRIIEVKMAEPDFQYNHKYVIPELSNDIDVQFFPESGALLNNGIQTVAFKAIGTDGLSRNVEGSIYNNSNEIVSIFKSAHCGMGKIAFNTNPGESYYALVNPESTIKKRYELPKTQAEGIIIHLSEINENINFEVINTTSKPDSTLSLLLHSRGKPIILESLKKSFGKIPTKILPEGIVSFSIIDTLGQIYCERVRFVKKQKKTTIEMNANKAQYGKRENVELNFNLKTLLENSSIGNYSISVTDSKLILPDSTNNIESYLLLTSDLKGHIENPAFYFNDNSRLTNEKLDLLMLTQGWTKFNTAEVTNGKHKINNQFYMEVGQALSGKVLNIFQKPVQKSQIIMFMGYKNQIATTETDSIGKFVIDGIEFPDSTSIILKAKKHKNLADVEIVTDHDVYTKPSCYFPATTNQTSFLPTDYFQLSKEKFYNEGGIVVVNLMEIDINASKKNNRNSKQYYSGFATKTINSEKLEQFPGMSFLDLLTTEPGIQVDGNQVSIRGSMNQPLFIIDGVETDNLQDLNYLTSNDIQEIGIFKGADASIFGSKGGSGAISITLKTGFVRKEQTPSSLAKLSPLGFQKKADFYLPKYSVDSIKSDTKQDLRSTIYWDPNLVSDSSGHINVKFNTADKANNYRVELEGITKNGQILRYDGYLRRENY